MYVGARTNRCGVEMDTIYEAEHAKYCKGPAILQ